jgi:hypothetical protein
MPAAPWSPIWQATVARMVPCSENVPIWQAMLPDGEVKNR